MQAIREVHYTSLIEHTSCIFTELEVRIDVYVHG
jgi:hypothetical protein